MAYLGGKARQSQYILNILNKPEYDGMPYIEPFCGYCHILRRVEHKSSYTASDNNLYLMTLLQHIKDNPNAHLTITKEEYASLRENKEHDILRSAYAGFTYSYCGRFFEGYAQDSEKYKYANARKKYYDSLYENETFQATTLKHCSYTEYSDVSGCLIYCDPPYRNTVGYHSKFNSDEFWEWARNMSKNNIVYISEYTAPEDFESISCFVKKTKINSGDKKSLIHIEHLYKLR